jgi:hypothetical protein
MAGVLLAAATAAMAAAGAAAAGAVRSSGGVTASKPNFLILYLDDVVREPLSAGRLLDASTTRRLLSR